MKIASVLIAYNEPEMALALSRQLAAQTAQHDIYILDNSSEENLVAKSPFTIDVGRKNLGWGGCHELFINDPRCASYDFVGFWNIDVTNVPKNFLKRIIQSDLSAVGAFSPSINRDGTGWPFMRRKKFWGMHRVPFIESICWYCRPVYLKQLLNHSPLPMKGWWIDIVACGYVKAAKQVCVVFDSVRVDHLGGQKKQVLLGAQLMGSHPEYNDKALAEASDWIGRSHAYEPFCQGHGGHMSASLEDLKKWSAKTF